jgi:hypothetical protein
MLSRLHSLDLLPVPLSGSDAQHLGEHKACKFAQHLCLLIRILVMPLVCLAMLIHSHDPNIISTKHCTPVCEIILLFHECVNESCPLDGPLVSNASWVEKELGDKSFSCRMACAMMVGFRDRI